jgi:DNA-binding HxlR family transcriptional regulator
MYGTLNLDRIEKAIYQEIRKRMKIRWRPLMQIIVPAECSERVFREKLNEMVEKGLVFKNEKSRQHVEYYVDSDIIKMEQNAEKIKSIKFPELKYFIKEIGKHASKIPLIDLASYIVILWRIIDYFEYNSGILAGITNNSQIQMREECDDLREQLMEMLYNLPKIDDVIQVLDLTSAIFDYDCKVMLDLLHQDLQSKNIQIVRPNDMPRINSS